MPDPCSCKNLLTILVIVIYIQKRTGEPGLFSFEYNLLPKLLTDVYHYLDQAKIFIQLLQEKMIWKKIVTYSMIGGLKKPPSTLM